MIEKQRTKYMWLSLVLLISAGLLSGCSLIKVGVSSLRSKQIFTQFETDKRIFVEPGAELYAKQIFAYLNEAISVVENRQYRPFNSSIAIYVCATQESFSKYSAASKKARAAMTLGIIYISPKFIEKAVNKGDLKKELIHELSHLHFDQQLGSYTYNSNIPFWFQEGLAMFVSDGSGIEINSEELKKYMVEGKTFTLYITGSVFFRDLQIKRKIPYLIWQKEVESFVAYLFEKNSNSFQSFISSLQTGTTFEKAFEQSYNKKIQDVWSKYVMSFKLA